MDELVENTLREVNMVRRDWGLEPLDDLLPGVPCQDDKCAIAASVVVTPGFNRGNRPGFIYTEAPDGRYLRAKMLGWLTVKQLPDASRERKERSHYQDCDIPNIQRFAQAFDRGEAPDRYYLPGTRELCRVLPDTNT